MRAKKGITNATSTTAPALDILPPATPRFRGHIGNAYVDCEADLIELPTVPAVPQRPFEQQVAGSLTVNVGHPGGVTVKAFAEPRHTVAHGGAGHPTFQLFTGVNLQFPLARK